MSDSLSATRIALRGSASPPCQELALRISSLLSRFSITLYPVWVPRSLNAVADAASRLLDHDDYFMTPSAFARVCMAFAFSPELDVFASAANAVVPRFFSRWVSPGCEGVDALSLAWPEVPLWVFPPFCMVLRALSHLLAHQVFDAVFVLPVWEGQAFWPLLAPGRGRWASFVLGFHDLGVMDFQRGPVGDPLCLWRHSTRRYRFAAFRLRRGRSPPLPIP